MPRVGTPVLLLLVALAATPATLSAEAVSAWRDLTAGDSWTYEGTDDHGRIEERSTREVGRPERIAVADEEHDTVRLVIRTVYRDTTSPSAPLETYVNTTRWLRPTDGAHVLVIESMQHRGSMTTNETRRLTYATPCPRYQFPLSEGALWRVSCDGVKEPASSGDGVEATHFVEEVLVEAVEQVETPAGTFTAYRLVRDRGPFVPIVTEWYAPEACGVVQRIVGGFYGPVRLREELTSVSCVDAADGPGRGLMSVPAPGIAVAVVALGLGVALRVKRTGPKRS